MKESITGILKKANCVSCVAGLKIECYDIVFTPEEKIDETISDYKGAFIIQLTEEYYKKLHTTKNPEMLFKIFRGTELLQESKETLSFEKSDGQKKMDVTINIKEKPGSINIKSISREVWHKFIPDENINVIQDAIKKTFQNSEEVKIHMLKVENFLKRFSLLDIMLNDSRDFLRGSLFAGSNLISNLEVLITNISGFNNGYNYSFPETISIPENFNIANKDFAEGDYPVPIEPNRNLGRRYPCLFPPENSTDIYSALKRLLLINPIPEVINKPDPYLKNIEYGFLKAIDFLLTRLSPLEFVYIAAQKVQTRNLAPEPFFRDALNSFHEFSFDGNFYNPPPSFFSNEEDIGLPIPGLGSYQLLPNPCKLAGAIETVRALTCFQELERQPKYEITDIFNVTHGVSRKGCHGDTIQIRGNNLGTEGTISFGIGSIATINSWDGNVIEFIVPNIALSNELGICITPDPIIPVCVDTVAACRLPAEHTDLSFIVLENVVINSYYLGGRTVLNNGPDTVNIRFFTAESCDLITLHLNIRNAEHASVTTSNGITIWRSSPMSLVPETIDILLPRVNTQQNSTFNISADNLCGSMFKTIQLNVLGTIFIEGYMPIRVGQTLNLSVRLSCPAPVGGLSLTAYTNYPEILIAPIGIVIPEGESVVNVSYVSPALGACGYADIIIDIPNPEHPYRPATLWALVLGTPIILTLSPPSVQACTLSGIDIIGNCFSPEESGNSVTGVIGSTIANFPITRVASASPRQNARLTVEVPPLSPGIWRIYVHQHGSGDTVTSNGFDLVSNPGAPEIMFFRNVPSSIAPCSTTNIYFNFSVLNVNKVEIVQGDSVVYRQNYTPVCEHPSTGDFTVSITQSQVFKLLAYPIDGGPAIESAPLYISEVDVPRLSSVVYSNDTADGGSNLTLTIWSENFSTGEVRNEGAINSGESKTITLTNCQYYRIAAVCKQWIDSYNLAYGTHESPDDPETRNTNFVQSGIPFDPGNSILGDETISAFYFPTGPGDLSYLGF